MIRIFSLLTMLISITGIYDYSIRDIDGNNINLSQFHGKKILIVNTASNSQYVSQYSSLEQLYEKYKDSLIVIAVPSGSFGNELPDSSAIRNFVISNYNIHFILASKTDVAGINQSPLYAWLTQAVKNGVMDNSLDNDFYKFLVDTNGNLVGAFAPSVDPMSQVVQNAIEQ
jgi:glutathione peroxidase